MHIVSIEYHGLTRGRPQTPMTPETPSTRLGTPRDGRGRGDTWSARSGHHISPRPHTRARTATAVSPIDGSSGTAHPHGAAHRERPRRMGQHSHAHSRADAAHMPTDACCGHARCARTSVEAQLLQRARRPGRAVRRFSGHLATESNACDGTAIAAADTLRSA